MNRSKDSFKQSKPADGGYDKSRRCRPSNMRRWMWAIVLPIMVCRLWSSAWAESAQGGSQDKWWLEAKRMLQTNLREIDATMDIEKYVQEVKDFGANVVLFNVGGIVANYPTDLENHWRNTFMEGDFLGTVLNRLHREGIRVIGRFDFSKINETFAAKHPDWLYVSEKGRNVNYNGQVHTCVSGGYQQEYMFEILGEALDRYPLDGVFFNMIGYTTSDYSGNYHGLCQCDNCKRLFREFADMELPRTANTNNPAYGKYGEFTRMMTDRQFRRVNEFLKAKRPDLAICTYTSAGVDVIRKESNRALGQGPYHDTELAKWTLLTCGERQLACTAVHFIRIPYRHAAVSPYLTARRVWQQMVNGAWLDFYCIGPLQRQEDRTGLDLAAGIFNFHKDNEQWLINTKSAAQIALVRQGDSECEGLMQILYENQVPFAFTQINSGQLADYSLVIVPDAGRLDSDQCKVLDMYVKNGGKLLTTKNVPKALQCIGPVTLESTRPAEKGAYIRIRPEDRRRFNRPVLDKLDLVFLSGSFNVYKTEGDVEGLLRLIPQDMFGPPEKCYYRQVSDHPALIYNKYGEGAVACFTFDIGTHYQTQCHQGHANLVMGAIDNVLDLERRLEVKTSPLVEVTHRTSRDGTFEWVGLFNHSGQLNNALHAPIPVDDIRISITPVKPIKAVRLLTNGRKLRVSKREDCISLTVPTLKHYDIVLLEYE